MFGYEKWFFVVWLRISDIYEFKRITDFDLFFKPRLDEEFVKTLDKVEIRAVASPLPDLPVYQHFRFYHIIIKGKSFLHNQVTSFNTFCL